MLSLMISDGRAVMKLHRAEAGGFGEHAWRGGSGRGPPISMIQLFRVAAVYKCNGSACTPDPEGPSCSFCLYQGLLITGRFVRPPLSVKGLCNFLSCLLLRAVNLSLVLLPDREGEKGDGKGLAGAA